jgi:hypothetical protein
MSELSQILETVQYIRGKVDDLDKNGCSKAASHADIEERMRAVEGVLAKASGAMVVLIGLAGAVGALVGWAVSIWTAARGRVAG